MSFEPPANQPTNGFGENKKNKRAKKVQKDLGQDRPDQRPRKGMTEIQNEKSYGTKQRLNEQPKRNDPYTNRSGGVRRHEVQ